MSSEDELRGETVLILAPTKKDSEITARLLDEVKISNQICENLRELCHEAQRGAGAAIVCEEAIVSDESSLLRQFLGMQPPWADFPLVVMTRRGLVARDSFPLLASYRNLTLIERPVQMAVLLSAVQTALRDRRRQYSLRDYLIEREKSEHALREADRRKDEFLAMLGHELRNPLAAISSGVRLLTRHNSSDEIRQLAGETLERQVKVLSRLLDDLLDLSRINSGKITLRKEPLNMEEVIERAVKVVQPLMDSAQHHLSVNLADAELWTIGDSVRMEQVLTNLLMNAAKYTKSGGRIGVSAGIEDKELVITISDTGVGISPTLLPHVFDLFTQEDRSIARSQGGLGIGLTLVKRIVQLHSGKVSATSQGQEKGSTFSVRLPLFERPVDSQSVESVAERSKRNKRILVVDDNQDAAKTLALFLTNVGHDVQIAFSGVEAVSKAERFRPEAALLDIGLPDVSGYDLATRLLRTPGLERLLLIAISGYAKPEDRKLSKVAGFNHHLAKPVDHDQLMALLNVN